MPLSADAGIVAAFEDHRRQLLRRGRAEALASFLILSLLLLVSLYVSEFLSGNYGDAPFARVAAFLQRMNPHLQPAELFGAPGTQGSLAYWFYGLPRWARALMISVEMALVGMLIGSAIAFAAAVMMARTLMPSTALRQAVRRVMDLLRTIPDFILAMLLVQAVGTGPLAGVLALTVTTFAGLARPLSEAMENADPRPMESVRAAGGGWFAQIRYGLVPLIAPNMISLMFVFLEINVSRSTALGIVGAGGIGQELGGALAYNQYDSYFAMMILIGLVVTAADLTSEQVRHRVFGLGQHR